jgi:hypothetical protein
MRIYTYLREGLSFYSCFALFLVIILPPQLVYLNVAKALLDMRHFYIVCKDIYRRGFVCTRNGSIWLLKKE